MTLDLSAITDSMLGLVRNGWASAPIWAQNGTPPAPQPNYTGLAPDAVRQQHGPQLSLYLYHVETNNSAEALFWAPQMLNASGGEPIRFLPLALDAFYLLSAYSENSYTDEQQAMSVAMRIFHDQPIQRSALGAPVTWELTLTPEHRSYDELSRLWQATTAPLRMSLVYRAAVVFLDPDEMPTPAPTPEVVHVGVGLGDPATFASAHPQPAPAGSPAAPTPGDPVLVGSARTVTYTAPDSETVSFQQTPATVGPGQQLSLLGSNLGTGASDTVYLLDGAGHETDVTGWTVAAASTGSRTVLQLPATVGTAPAASPAPGMYQFRIGHGALGAAGSYRTNATPVGVAAVVSPAGGPVLSGAGPYTVQGQGFEASSCEVLLGTIALAGVSGTPAAGQVAINPSGTSLSLRPPAGLGAAVVPIRVRVAGVESDPALWVAL